MRQNDIIEIGKRADNGILYNRIVNAGLFADRYIGANNRIPDIAARGDADWLDYDGILKLMIRRNVAAKFLQKLGVGLKQGFFFTAIEPVLNLEGMEFNTATDHTFDGVRKTVF